MLYGTATVYIYFPFTGNSWNMSEANHGNMSEANHGNMSEANHGNMSEAIHGICLRQIMGICLRATSCYFSISEEVHPLIGASESLRISLQQISGSVSSDISGKKLSIIIFP